MSQIPKIIHYVWVGGKPLTPLAEKCIASWKRYLPDYEIKQWDETNSPMNHPYVAAMYEAKKWAFVSDYIRFVALESEGGIYLDTDQEILRSLDGLLGHEGFVGRSRHGQIESSIIAAVPGADFLRKALAFYNTDTKRSIENTSPKVLESAIQQSFSVVQVFGPEYFHPIDEGEYITEQIRNSAYGIHHWAESWVSYARTRKILRRVGILSLLKRLRNLRY